MKLLYTIAVPITGSVELKVPFGVSSCKMRIGRSGKVENVGVIVNSGVNEVNDIKFPIINGKSPNTFRVSQTGSPEAETIFYLLVTEIGGLPDPAYFTGGDTSE